MAKRKHLHKPSEFPEPIEVPEIQSPNNAETLELLEEDWKSFGKRTNTK